MVIDFSKTPVYMVQPYHVNGPIWVHVTGKPINDDKFMVGEIKRMTDKDFAKYCTLSKQTALIAYRDDLERKVQNYINIHLKHGLGTLVDIEHQARMKYKRHITRAEKKLKKYESNQ